MTNIGRGDRRFKEISARLRKERPPVCWLCSEPIDLNAPPRTARSWSLDHIKPLSEGGDPYDESNLAPAHVGCNSRKGNSELPQTGTVISSRTWR